MAAPLNSSMALRIAAGLAGLAAPLLAQEPATPPWFADSARAGTAVYRNLEHAIASGYRAIGPESPAMGQHWVNVRILMEGRLDPARPAILTFIFPKGRPRLAGVAYALALAPGEPDPAAFAGAERWHFHSGSVIEEAVLTEHKGHGAREAGTFRIAVLHAWTWIPNPAGLFAADNWTLPWVRRGWAAPEEPDPDAGRAIALANGSAQFFAQQYSRAAALDSLDRATVTTAFREREEAIQSQLDSEPIPAQRELAEWWRQVITGVRSRLSPEGRQRWPSPIPLE